MMVRQARCEPGSQAVSADTPSNACGSGSHLAVDLTGGEVCRDVALERALLEGAELAANTHAGAGGFSAHARQRLEVGESAYGSRWARAGWQQLAQELTEEAADLGAWSALTQHTIDRDLPASVHTEARALLETIALHGAIAHAAAERLRGLSPSSSPQPGDNTP